MDKLAELEKAILDYYLLKGYQINKGNWSFKLEISTKWKFKQITVFFWDNNNVDTPYYGISNTTKEMFNKAISFFNNIEYVLYQADEFTTPQKINTFATKKQAEREANRLQSKSFNCDAFTSFYIKKENKND